MTDDGSFMPGATERERQEPTAKNQASAESQGSVEPLPRLDTYNFLLHRVRPSGTQQTGVFSGTVFGRSRTQLDHRMQTTDDTIQAFRTNENVAPLGDPSRGGERIETLFFIPPRNKGGVDEGLAGVRTVRLELLSSVTPGERVHKESRERILGGGAS